MNNRQNGRRRGRNNQRSQGGQGRGGDNGNRIDSRARGNAVQLLEKYKNLAREAQMAGDRVQTEYYLQFADHYFRVIADVRARQDEQRPRGDDRDYDDRGGDNGGFDGNDDAGDAPYGQQSDDGGDLVEPVSRRRDGGQRSENTEENYNRNEGRGEGRNESRGEGRGDDRGDDGDPAPRRNANPRPRRRPFGERDDQSGGNQSGGNPSGGRHSGGRPPRGNADAGDVGGIDLAVLPPAINAGGDVGSVSEAPANDAPRPRRARTPRKAEGADAAADA